jgi:hypothetical protein
MVYTLFRPDSPPAKYVLSCHDDDFFLRQVKEGEDFVHPISITNKMRGSFFAGRSGSVRWQINGFGVGESFNGDGKDAYTIFSETTKSVANGILNLGPQMIEPGTFVWDGESFEARPSLTAQQLAPQISSFSGKIRVEDGRIVELASPKGGTYRYEYDAHDQLPAGFPSRILSMRTGDWKPAVQFHEVKFEQEDSPLRPFVPESFIQPDLMLLTVYSNNVQLRAPDSNNPEVVRLVSDEHAGLKRAGRGARQRILMFAIAVSSLIPIWWFTRRLMRPEPVTVK